MAPSAAVCRYRISPVTACITTSRWWAAHRPAQTCWPQSTPQSDKQIKYDGSRTIGKHILRYGVDFNHIQGGGFASFFKLAPQIVTNQNQFSNVKSYNGVLNPCGIGGS